MLPLSLPGTHAFLATPSGHPFGPGALTAYHPTGAFQSLTAGSATIPGPLLQLPSQPPRQLINAGPNALVFQQGLAPATAFQPILYWYPSPPVSPQNTAGIHGGTAANPPAAYYVQATTAPMTSLPTTVVIKGLPPNVQTNDIMSLVDGLIEVSVGR